jgi:hypothetical protein
MRTVLQRNGNLRDNLPGDSRNKLHGTGRDIRGCGGLAFDKVAYVNRNPPVAAIPLSGTGQRPFCCNSALLAISLLSHFY